VLRNNESRRTTMIAASYSILARCSRFRALSSREARWLMKRGERGGNMHAHARITHKCVMSVSDGGLRIPRWAREKRIRFRTVIIVARIHNRKTLLVIARRDSPLRILDLPSSFLLLAFSSPSFPFRRSSVR